MIYYNSHYISFTSARKNILKGIKITLLLVVVHIIIIKSWNVV
jgi:hypothetical protein